MQLAAGNDPERFWCAVYGAPDRVAPALGRPDAVRAVARGTELSFWWGDQKDLIQFAEDERHVCLIFGHPEGLDEEEDDDAVALMKGYARHGKAIIGTLGGWFCALVADTSEGELLAVRDPLGVRPLFYTERDGGVAISPSPELLAHCGSRRPSPDRLALAEWVMTTSTPMKRTLYAGVSRVPPGHTLALTKGKARVSRYWNPEVAKPDERLDGEEALARFDIAFDRAVGRCARNGPTAVFLSGGLDSALGAASLSEHQAGRGLEPPLAMTLKFPAPDEDEEQRAREVAHRLGLPHLVVSFDEALHGRGLFPSGIEASERSWYPTTNPWNTTAAYLRREALGRGYQSALSGEGGNDLLEAPWELAGDLIRQGNVRELLRFIAAQERYYGGGRRRYARQAVWERGLAALARPVAHRGLLAVMPDRVARLRTTRAAAGIPPWALPGPSFRAEVVDYRSWVMPALTSDDLHGYARRKFLDSAFNAIMLEGLFLTSRRSGFEDCSPYLDPDLVGLVLALPPLTLQLGGHVKGLALTSFCRRVDGDLGRRLRPSGTSATFEAAYSAEVGGVLAKLGGLPRLSELGIVSAPATLALVDPSRVGARSYYQRWQILATEAWLQARDF